MDVKTGNMRVIVVDTTPVNDGILLYMRAFLEMANTSDVVNFLNGYNVAGCKWFAWSIKPSEYIQYA